MHEGARSSPSLAADCKLPSASAVHFPAYLVVQFAVHAARRHWNQRLARNGNPPINTAFTDKEAASCCVRVVHIAACLVVQFSLSSSTTGTLIDKRACLFLFVRVRVRARVCVCVCVRAGGNHRSGPILSAFNFDGLKCPRQKSVGLNPP